MQHQGHTDWRATFAEWRDRDVLEAAGVFFRETIWRPDNGEHGRVFSLVRRFCRVAYVFGHGSLDRHVLTSASALTFHTLLSLVPMLAVAFSVAKGLGFKTTAVRGMLLQLSAGQTEITERVLAYVENTGVAALGAAAGLSLIYTAISIIGRHGD